MTTKNRSLLLSLFTLNVVISFLLFVASLLLSSANLVLGDPAVMLSVLSYQTPAALSLSRV